MLSVEYLEYLEYLEFTPHYSNIPIFHLSIRRSSFHLFRHRDRLFQGGQLVVHFLELIFLL